jgi:GAF domain-containing protein
MMAGTGGGKSINENVTKDGQLRICEWYNTALMDSEGQRVGAASVVQDITERQRAEEAERHSRMVTEAITDASIHFLETASVGAMAQLVVEYAVRITGAELGLVVEMVPSDRGPQPRILAVSEMAWSTMKGHSLYSEAKESISEKGFYSLALSEALVFSPMIEGATVLANDPSSHPLWQGRMPSGHPVIESFLGVPMKIGDEILGMIALANRPQGFGEREVRELETFATTGALALRMGRTEEDRRRMEEQLRQSQKMEAVGQLAGGVAHDFNNLLMAILGNAEFAMDGLAPQDPRRGNLEGIQAAGERAATLTRQLLAFSRRQVLRPEDLDLNAVVGELIKMLGRLIGENIHLEILPASDPGLIRADRAQIEQVLMILVVNARDAMPEGERLRSRPLQPISMRTIAGSIPGWFPAALSN